MGPLRLLLVEDSEHDAELLLRYLRDHGYEVEHRRVNNGYDMQEALRTEKWDLIISDYTVPGFGGLEALKVAKQDSPDIPFIIVSGNIGEDLAAAAMVAGAQDYVMKNSLARLLPAIERELKEAESHRERKLTEQALLESEELFSKAFYYSPAMMIISELSENFAGGRVLNVNKSFLQAIGYERDKVIGHSFAEIGLFAYEGQREEVMKLLREYGRINDIELPFRTRTGEIRYGLGSIELLEINATPCVLLIGLDITERKQVDEELARYSEQLEEQVAARTKDLTEVVADLESEIAERRRIETALIDANYQAKQANLAKTGFLANMSHELRTPLNSIIGFAELLMLEPEDVIDNESRQKLGYILDSAWHLLSLINDILDLSKIEAGKLVFEPASVNIPNVVEASLVMLRDKASKAHVSLHSEIEPGITKLIADERKLKQILSNLIGNAIKFSNEQGQVRVRVSMAGLEEFKAHCVTPGTIQPNQAKFVRFSVEDDGIGIGAEDIGKLFQPFVQLDASLTRRHEGSGLGLHLSRQLVELHGGCIWAESEAGKGSTFSFILPCGSRD